MNDKELFWSLISPHLVDRPEAYGRVPYGIDRAMAPEGVGGDSPEWRLLKNYIMQNFKFIMPSNLKWNNPYQDERGYYWIPNSHPLDMVVYHETRRGSKKLMFHISDNLSIMLTMSRITGSSNEYAIGNIHKISSAFTMASTKTGSYAIYKNWTNEFINWINDPFTLK
tara:strand:+ start:3709 stop:4212 length:504 start_codon:yes stop_codon:yes gene_type:complete